MAASRIMPSLVSRIAHVWAPINQAKYTAPRLPPRKLPPTVRMPWSRAVRMPAWVGYVEGTVGNLRSDGLVLPRSRSLQPVGPLLRGLAAAPLSADVQEREGGAAQTLPQRKHPC